MFDLLAAVAGQPFRKCFEGKSCRPFDFHHIARAHLAFDEHFHDDTQAMEARVALRIGVDPRETSKAEYPKAALFEHLAHKRRLHFFVGVDQSSRQNPTASVLLDQHQPPVGQTGNGAHTDQRSAEQ